MALPFAAKSFALAAALVVLMLPTFNALNVAEFGGDPPFSLDPPDDVDPPDDLEGDFGEGDSGSEVPPAPGANGSCKPQRKDHPSEEHRFEAGPASVLGEGDTIRFRVPPEAVAVSLVAQFRNWRGTLDVEWTPPAGEGDEESFSTSPTRVSARSDTDARPLGEARTGEWRAEWSATSYAGGGGLVLVYHTLGCAEAAAGPDDEGEAPAGNATFPLPSVPEVP